MPNAVSRYGKWAIPCLLTLWLFTGPLGATAKKPKANSQDPYATAELETAPAVNAADLASRVVLLDKFTIPAEWEKDARKLATATEDRAIARLTETGAFTKVARKEGDAPGDPALVVNCKLLNYRMVSGKTRFFAGALAGTSYITYQVKVTDAKSGELLFQREVSTENNAFAAAWSFNDKNLPVFLGNVLGDYLALRARKDKGVSVLPIESGASAK
jgi:hypothetical protein